MCVHCTLKQFKTKEIRWIVFYLIFLGNFWIKLWYFTVEILCKLPWFRWDKMPNKPRNMVRTSFWIENYVMAFSFKILLDFNWFIVFLLNELIYLKLNLVFIWFNQILIRLFETTSQQIFRRDCSYLACGYSSVAQLKKGACKGI